MTSVGNIFAYIFPVLVIALALALLCFYVDFKGKIHSLTYNVTTPTTQDGSSPGPYSIPLPEEEAEEVTHYDRFPPRYSTVDHPPPYSLFDPKLTGIWPGGPPPAYEMYPITLPLAPHHWRTPEEPLHLTPSSSPSARDHPQTQRSRQSSTS